MQWHSQAGEWVVGKISALSPRARLLGVVLILVAGLLLLLTTAGQAPRETEFLFGGRSFSLSEIAAIESALAKAGLSESVVDGNRLRIPRDQKDVYLKALVDDKALPGGIEPNWDAYMPDSPFASREMVEQKSRHADQQKLARIIQAMHGIESATVNCDAMKKSGFPPTIEKRAVVVVRAGEGRHLSFDQIEAIRATVTGYVSGLDRRAVTVTDLNAVRAYPGDLSGPFDDQNDATAVWMLEKAYREKILRRLERYPGVVVGVSVQVSAADSPPGAVVAAGTNDASSAPALLTVSIDIPRTYFQRVWRDRFPQDTAGPATEQLSAIEHDVKLSVQRAVSALLPPSPPEWAAIEQVTVTTYDDLAHPADSLPAGHPNSVDPQVLEQWLLLIGGGLIVAIVLLWRAVRLSGRSGPREMVVEPPPRAAGIAEPVLQSPSLDPPLPTAANWQQELVKAVQQDPDAAAKAMQRWIKNAA